MRLGIADICLWQHMRVGRMTQVDFVRRAAALGAETASLRIPKEASRPLLPCIAEEVGIELEFRTGTTEPEELSEWIRVSHDLGASFLRTMVSGHRWYSDAQKQTNMLESARAGLRAVVPLLEERDMTLGVENHADVTSGELVQLIEDVGSDRVRVLLDFTNSVVVFEDPRETIERLAPYAVAVHAKDMAIGPRGLVDFCLLPVPFGDGIIDFDHAMEVLMAHCPDARFTVEGVHPPLDDLEESLRAEAAMLEKSVAFSRELFARYR